MLRRLKEWFRNMLISLHARDLERGGWNQRVGRPLIVVYLANVILFQVVYRTQAIPTDSLPTFIFAFVVVQLVLGAFLIGTMIRAFGRQISIYFIGLMVVVVVLVVVAYALPVLGTFFPTT